MGDVAAETLERDAHDFPVLQHGSAAVTGVDGGVDLDGQVGIDVGVGVGAEVDSGDDATGDREAFTADGVSIDADFGFNFGDCTEFEGEGVVEKGFVFQFEDGEIAVVCDVLDGCDVFFGIALFFEGEEPGIGNDVRVRDDAFVFSRDNPARAGTSFGCAWEPRHPVVGFEGAIDDAREAFSHLGGVGGGVGVGEA